jgi:hypothetical protein
MRSFWIALLLTASWVNPIRANECESKALEIARNMGLDVGQRTPTNSIPLSARTEADDDYGVYLFCNGTLGMTLRYLSPPTPGRKWFEFVGRSGTILTKVGSAFIALEARNCVENARIRETSFRSLGSALQMVCSVSKIDERAEISLAVH